MPAPRALRAVNENSPRRTNGLRAVDIVTKRTDDVVEAPSPSNVPAVEGMGACDMFRDDPPQDIERGPERRCNLTQGNSARWGNRFIGK